jgi:hypothetical protein
MAMSANPVLVREGNRFTIRTHLSSTSARPSAVASNHSKAPDIMTQHAASAPSTATGLVLSLGAVEIERPPMARHRAVAPRGVTLITWYKAKDACIHRGGGCYSVLSLILGTIACATSGTSHDNQVRQFSGISNHSP